MDKLNLEALKPGVAEGFEPFIKGQKFDSEHAKFLRVYELIVTGEGDNTSFEEREIVTLSIPKLKEAGVKTIQALKDFGKAQWPNIRNLNLQVCKFRPKGGDA